jgi:2-(1,2-epoxy-1,2-dihydrophenyl)acetyl-CoA isomerase
MEYEKLILSKEDGVATIVLNRPEVLNALDAKLSEELGLAVDEVSRDDLVRVLVLTGAGKGFCAGGDLKDTPINRRDVVASTRALEKWHDEVLLGLRRMEKPTIASVNGVAVGAGLGLALMCDIVIAAENARFGEVYVRIGGTSDSGGTYLLPRLIGIPRACEFLFTGDMIDAKDAGRMGLVNRVVPPDKLEPTTRELAARLARGAPKAIGMLKRAIYRNINENVESALHYENYMTNLCLQTEDAQEGVAAFMEKRAPIFKGK